MAEIGAARELVGKGAARPGGDLTFGPRDWQQVVDTAYQGIWALDERFVTTFVNDRMAELLQVQPREMPGRSFKEFVFPEDLPSHELQVSERRAGRSGSYERRLRRTDGSSFWAIVSATPQLDPEGRFTGSFALITDITSRKEIEVALQRRTAELEAIYENAPVMMCVLDADRRVLYANRAFTEFTGLSETELRLGAAGGVLGCMNSLEDPRGCGFGTDCAPCPLRAAIDDTVRTGRSHRDVEYRGTVARDGRVHQVVLLAATASARGAAVPAILVCIQDISPRVKAEAALVDSEARYRALFENAVEGIFQTAPDGRILHVNPAAARMNGFETPEEFADAVNLRGHLPWADPEACRRFASLLEAEGTVRGLEMEVRRPDGRTSWLSINASAARDAGGNVVRFEGTTIDITAMREARQALAEQARFLQTLVDAMPHPVYFKGRDGKYLGCNRAFETIMGLTKAQILGRTVLDVFPGASAALSHEQDEALFASPGAQFVEASLETPAGPRGTGLFQKATFEGPDGSVAGIIGSIVDVTELKRAEADVRRLNDDLEARVRERTHELTVANGELESFAYSVSHDLRAPLRAIASFSQLVQAEGATLLPDRSREYLGRVITAAEKMSGLIDALLGLSRIARRELRVEPIDLSAAAHEVARELIAGQPSRAVDLVVAEGLRTEGDPELARIVLRNLLENALKFSAARKPARIEIGSVSGNPPGEPGPAGTVFFVRDNGAGFDMQYAEKMFGPFQRLHAEAEFPGNGIGLATAQRILHRHGGRIWADAAPGAGATFSFTFGRGRA